MSARSTLSLVDSLESRRLLDGNGPGTSFLQTNLVSDGAVPAAHMDDHLKNPWGLAASGTSPFWISDNATSISTVYNGAGVVQPPFANIPPAMNSDAGAPTGDVFNTTASSFALPTGGKALFLFASEDGGISGWNMAQGHDAVIVFDGSSHDAIYKGLTIGTANGQDFLYAADFHNGKVTVINSSYQDVTPAGAFVDDQLPPHYAPFNVQNLNGKIYVTFAKQDADAEDDVAGAGHGFVDVFDSSGVLLQRLEHNGHLNSPWGLAIAPASFGRFGGDLLVGQFGSGEIVAYDDHGVFQGELHAADHGKLRIDGLWALRFGNGGAAGSPDTLFFTAGLNDEADGLFGSLVPAPHGRPAASASQVTAVLSGRSSSTDASLFSSSRQDWSDILG